MNRHQRRRAKALKEGVVTSSILAAAPWKGQCRVFCAASRREWPCPEGPRDPAPGCAVIELNDREGELMVLCEQCWSSDSGDIIRQVFGINLKITDGGYATPEEVAEIAGALAEKQSAVEH